MTKKQTGIEQFLARLEKQNKTLTTWARENNHCIVTCYQIAAGKLVGRHGKAREVVIAMGLEPPPMYGNKTGTRERRAA